MSQMGNIFQGEEYQGQIEIDLGNLAAYVSDEIDTTTYDNQNGSAQNGQTQPNNPNLLRAQKITQNLVSEIFKLPRESNEAGIFALLPPPTLKLPREKPIPKAQPLTRWQKFAKDKGIVKKKRSKMVWDDQNQEYRRRYGYKGVSKADDVDIIEAGPNDKVGDDPFEKLYQERSKKRKAQDSREIRNIQESQQSNGKQIPTTVKLAASQIKKHHTIREGRDAKPAIDKSKDQAKYSTASLGKKGQYSEKKAKKQPGQKRKFHPLIDKEEQGRMGKHVDKYLRTQADDIIDVNAIK